MLNINTFVDIAVTVFAVGLVALMWWSLVSLSHSPLNGMQRIRWTFSILILPGIGSFAWWWWMKRYYPRRKAEDPKWDPAENTYSRQQMGRPRPNRGRYKGPTD